MRPYEPGAHRNPTGPAQQPLAPSAGQGTHPALQPLNTYPTGGQDSPTVSGSRDAGASWRDSLLNQWYRFAAPPVRAFADDPTARARDLYRRGLLLAQSLLVLTLVGALTMLATAPSLLGEFSLATFSDFAATVALVGLALISAALNQRGHVNIAATLALLSMIVVVIVPLVVPDITSSGTGYTWIDAGGWYLMIGGLMIVALTQSARETWFALALFIAVVIGFALFVPQDPSVLKTDVASGLSAVGQTGMAQQVSLILDLTWRPIALAVFVLGVGALSNRGTRRALEDLAAQEYRTAVAEYYLQTSEQTRLRREAEQRWVVQLLALLVQSAREGRGEIILPPLPPTFADNPDLVTQYRFMQQFARSLPAAFTAQRAIQRLKEYEASLPTLLWRVRSEGSNAGMMPGGDEYLAVAHLPGGSGHAELDSALVDMGFYLNQLGRETEAATTEIQRTIVAVGEGQSQQRVARMYYTSRVGGIARSINWLLDRVQLTATTPLRGPFESDEGR